MAERERRLLEQVAEAQAAAFAAIAIGRAASDVDRAAREALEREGSGARLVMAPATAWTGSA